MLTISKKIEWILVSYIFRFLLVNGAKIAYLLLRGHTKLSRMSSVIVLGKDKSCFIGLVRCICCGGIGLSECKRCHSEDGFETFAEILGR